MKTEEKQRNTQQLSCSSHPQKMSRGHERKKTKAHANK